MVAELYLPPKPAIIRPAEKKLIKASFMPGAFPCAAGIVAAPGGLGSLSFVDEAVSLSSSVTAPATVNAGDLFVMSNCALYAPAAVPTGFTQIGTTLSADLTNVVSYKITDGTEDSSTITGMSGAYGINYITLQQFRATGTPISSVTVQDNAQQVTAGDPTGQTCNASGGTVPLIVIGMYAAAAGPIGTRSFSPAADGETSATDGLAELYQKYKLYDTSPADHTIDSGDNGFENFLRSFYLELA